MCVVARERRKGTYHNSRFVYIRRQHGVLLFFFLYANYFLIFFLIEEANRNSWLKVFDK